MGLRRFSVFLARLNSVYLTLHSPLQSANAEAPFVRLAFASHVPLDLGPRSSGHYVGVFASAEDPLAIPAYDLAVRKKCSKTVVATFKNYLH
jgi:hypothetical protein